MKKLWLTFLLTVMTGYIVGLNLLAPVNSSISVIVTPAYKSNVVSVVQLIPIVAIVILIIDSLLAIDDHRD
jgi:hypothetical protein